MLVHVPASSTPTDQLKGVAMDSVVVKFNDVSQGAKRRGRMRLSELLRDNPDVDPYPEGWFVIEFTSKVKTDRLISKKFFGEDVVIFRHPETHQVMVTQAHCPHLGAHFDSYRNGGCLENGVITCPYHHIKFDPQRQASRCPDSPPGRMDLKIYPTVEYHGFVLALRQRDGSTATLPVPDLSFPEVDEDAFLYDVQSVGIFQGDMLVPLMANSDYMHFQTVHGTPEPASDHAFRVADDGQSCFFNFEIPLRNLEKVDPQYPRAGRWRRLRRTFARPSNNGKKLPEVLTHVSAAGIGPGLAKSRWWEPQFGIDLLSWLYVTPIDPYTYELFMCHGARTIKTFNSRPVQTILNALGLQAHMLANHLYVGQEDPPFYTADKIRLAYPSLRGKDRLIDQYTGWWKSTFFTPQFQEMVDGYDLDFTRP
jgi:phenylpropionate dioxygenase-like ring-hydroxylating dioxygenase large terminal subunit